MHPSINIYSVIFFSISLEYVVTDYSQIRKNKLLE